MVVTRRLGRVSPFFVAERGLRALVILLYTGYKLLASTSACRCLYGRVVVFSSNKCRYTDECRFTGISDKINGVSLRWESLILGVATGNLQRH